MQITGYHEILFLANQLQLPEGFVESIVCCIGTSRLKSFATGKIIHFAYIVSLFVINVFLADPQIFIGPASVIILPLCLSDKVSHLVSLLVQRCKPNITVIFNTKWSYSRNRVFCPSMHKLKRTRKKIHRIRTCMHDNKAKYPADTKDPIWTVVTSSRLPWPYYAVFGLADVISTIMSQTPVCHWSMYLQPYFSGCGAGVLLRE